MSGKTLKLMSYNIQVGIPTRHLHEYFTHSWKHFIPHASRQRNLDLIAGVLAGHDIIGLQESDAGSLRSDFVNLTEYLAQKAGFPYWHHKVTRRVGGLASYAHGLISRVAPGAVETFELPGLIPGRAITVARYGVDDSELTIFHAHLSLTRRARRGQLAFIAEMMQDHPHAVLMGDFNTRVESEEMKVMRERTGLRAPKGLHHTFPSWKPAYDYDQVLVSPGIEVRSARVLQHPYSDHLPLSVEIALPESVLVV